jgi:drug/metabolite transporter (DMT)-like permease
MPDRTTRAQAIAGLLLANFLWGLSFPLIKAIIFAHQQVLPGSNHWFVTTMTVAPRFLLATALLGLVLRRQLATLAAGEVRQGMLLGLSAALGMYLQNDGLHFTSASTSAFLTQFYAIMIPVWVAVRARRAPAPVIWLSCALVLAGVAVLGRFDWRELRLGRGEVETLLSSFFFMWQILLLSDRRYAANRTLPVTTVMFATEAVGFTLLAFATAEQPADFLTPWAAGPWLGFTLLITLFCTLGSFTLMNRFQPRISATEAGLIYCIEPVFTALMALFLPGWFSRWAGFHYANETVTWHLLVGGSLVTLANILIQLRPPPPPQAA